MYLWTDSVSKKILLKKLYSSTDFPWKIWCWYWKPVFPWSSIKFVPVRFEWLVPYHIICLTKSRVMQINEKGKTQKASTWFYGTLQVIIIFKRRKLTAQMRRVSLASSLLCHFKALSCKVTPRNKFWRRSIICVWSKLIHKASASSLVIDILQRHAEKTNYKKIDSELACTKCTCFNG